MAETPLQYHRPLIPMGLAYLGSMIEEEYTGGGWEDYVQTRLEKEGVGRYKSSGVVAAQDNMFLSFYNRFDQEQLLLRMEEFSKDCPPDRFYIGLSVLSDGMRTARKLLKAFRLHFPLAKIMVGGPHATFFPYDFFEFPDHRENPLADYVVTNEGEHAILAIINEQLATEEGFKRNYEKFGLNPGQSDYSIPNYRVIDGGQFKGDLEKANLHVLDELPPPAYFLFEDENGILPYEPDKRYGLEAPAANINSSRGCPHKCTFCTIPKLAPGYRSLSPTRMADLVQFLNINYRVQSIFFREDNFMYSGGTIKGDRWEDIQTFCEELLDRRLKIKWAIEARADNILQQTRSGKQRIDLLQESGLTGVYIGVESGEDLMLKLYAKGTSVDEMSEGIKVCHNRNVTVVATSIYSDPDLLLKRNYPNIDLNSHEYRSHIIKQRERILESTRQFMDANNIPLPLREEYAMVGIPISTIYNMLLKEKENHSFLVEYYDDQTRYLYPKGFQWWSTKIYQAKNRVRSYFGYNFNPF